MREVQRRKSSTDRLKPIFISAFAYDNGHSGIAEYIRQICLHLSKFSDITIAVTAQEKSLLKKHLRGNSHLQIRYITAPSYCNTPLGSIFWHTVILPLFTPWKNYRCIILPAANRRLFCFYPLLTIATVHDLAQYHVDCKYDWKRNYYVKRLLPKLIKGVDQIIAVSHSSRRDLERYWHIDSEKIQVAYNGYDQLRFRDRSPENMLQVKNKYKLKKAFILYVARIEHPGKNHVKLIEAYERLPQAIQQHYDLVFAGSPWLNAEVVTTKVANSLIRENIKLLGFVAADELPALYHLCSLHVMPSLYEGFGIPIVEAFACGTPTICSANSSLSEIGGDAVLTFDPLDTDNISATIRRVLQDPQQRHIMITKGLQRCALFDWRHHTDKILKLIH